MHLFSYAHEFLQNFIPIMMIQRQAFNMINRVMHIMVGVASTQLPPRPEKNYFKTKTRNKQPAVTREKIMKQGVEAALQSFRPTFFHPAPSPSLLLHNRKKEEKKKKRRKKETKRNESVPDGQRACRGLASAHWPPRSWT